MRHYWAVRLGGGGRYLPQGKEGNFIAIGWDELGDLDWFASQSVESKEAVVVGVNRFTSEEEELSPPVLRVNPVVETDRRQRLAALRSRRDGPATEAALDRVEAAARGDDNLMPPIIEAVERLATLGEISDRLRRVFGTHAETFAF